MFSCGLPASVLLLILCNSIYLPSNRESHRFEPFFVNKSKFYKRTVSNSTEGMIPKQALKVIRSQGCKLQTARQKHFISKDRTHLRGLVSTVGVWLFDSDYPIWVSKRCSTKPSYSFCYTHKWANF